MYIAESLIGSFMGKARHLICGVWHIVVLFSALVCLPPRVEAQAVEVGVAAGKALKMDSYLDKMYRQTDCRSYYLGYVFQTTPSQGSPYAADFGYPTFTFGLIVADFNDVRIKHPSREGAEASRLGTSFILYGNMRRPFFRSRSGWGADYALHNGISYNTYPFSWDTNIDNEIIGSPFSIYFGVDFQLSYQYRQLQFFAGPEFRHLSNGALARPNKGVNKLGVAAGVRYLLRPMNMSDTLCQRIPFVDRGFYTTISLHTGFMTSVGEWILCQGAGLRGEPLSYDRFKMYVSYGISADVMYRYSRRFASGIGVDAYCEPYIRKAATLKGPIPADMSQWSLGVAAKHEVFYERLSFHLAVGFYISRPFADYAIAGEEPFYERVGLRYTLPLYNDRIRVGYNIHAHFTKAYASELVVDFLLPW